MSSPQLQRDDPTASALERLPTGGETTNDLYLWSTADGRMVVKVYRQRGRWHRRARERSLLKLWDRHGLSVPKVCETVVPLLPEPYLVMSFVPGVSLRDFLRDGDRDQRQKLALLERAYREMRQRQELALATGDLMLIHADCNTGNVILCEEVPVWIDLESGRRAPSVVNAAAAEICKFTRWVVADLSIDSVDRVCDAMCAAYRGHELLLERVHSATCDRPFQSLHRWRNRRRKIRAPHEVTTYDVVDALQRALMRAGQRQRPGSIPEAQTSNPTHGPLQHKPTRQGEAA